MKYNGIILAVLLLIITSCLAKSESNTLPKVEIDLSELDENGLRGPADGKASVAYEFCIPNTEKCKAEVRSIDSSIQFMPGSSGRIGAGKNECLCVGETGKDYRQVLHSLAELPYIKRIIECHFE